VYICVQISSEIGFGHEFFGIILFVKRHTYQGGYPIMKDVLKSQAPKEDFPDGIMKPSAEPPEVRKAEEGIEMTSNEEDADKFTVVKVIGVGGGGSNAVKHMIAANLGNTIDFYVVDTDRNALATHHDAERVEIGLNTISGLGANGNPELGRKAAFEDKDKLEDITDGADLAFIVATIGGGTGTAVAPIIAKLAKDKGALTIGFATKPFLFEGRERMRQAEEGITALKEFADSVVVIPNQRLIEKVEHDTPTPEDFRMADEALLQGVKSISDLIAIRGKINLDFSDVKTIMSETGGALMGIGFGTGAENRAQIAAKNAVSCSLLEEGNIKGAKGILINITGGIDMTLYEVQEAM